MEYYSKKLLNNLKHTKNCTKKLLKIFKHTFNTLNDNKSNTPQYSYKILVWTFLITTKIEPSHYF